MASCTCTYAHRYTRAQALSCDAQSTCAYPHHGVIVTYACGYSVTPNAVTPNVRVRVRAQVLARDAQTVELLLERGAG